MGAGKGTTKRVSHIRSINTINNPNIHSYYDEFLDIQNNLRAEYGSKINNNTRLLPNISTGHSVPLEKSLSHLYLGRDIDMSNDTQARMDVEKILTEELQTFFSNGETLVWGESEGYLGFSRGRAIREDSRERIKNITEKIEVKLIDAPSRRGDAPEWMITFELDNNKLPSPLEDERIYKSRLDILVKENIINRLNTDNSKSYNNDDLYETSATAYLAYLLTNIYKSPLQKLEDELITAEEKANAANEQVEEIKKKIERAKNNN